MARKKEVSKSAIVIAAVVLSIVLYMSGVMSGLYANKILEEKTQADIKDIKHETSTSIASLKVKTEEDLGFLQDYVEFLESNLKNIQLNQLFLDTLDDDERCEFSRIMADDLIRQLGFYWTTLPPRIEAYERYVEPTEEYDALKRQYIQLSLRTWIVMRDQFKECDTDLVPVLYLYAVDCDTCIEQGEKLDELQSLEYRGKRFIVFTVDKDDEALTQMVSFYNISTTPALVIEGRVFQGEVFTKEDVLRWLQ